MFEKNHFTNTPFALTSHGLKLKMKLYLSTVLCIHSFLLIFYSDCLRDSSCDAPGRTDWLTFGPAGNESENQANSFLLLFPPRETPFHLGGEWWRKHDNNPNIAAPLCSLPRKPGGRGRRANIGDVGSWGLFPPPLPPHLPLFPPFLLPLS